MKISSTNQKFYGLYQSGQQGLYRTQKDHTYKGIPCICIENAGIKAIFLPDQGAKLCSFVEKAGGQEYIYQGKTTDYRIARYGQDFLEGECAGVDEMFPNIDACYYDREPWEGIKLPDHGEVWAREWEVQLEKEAVCFQIVGLHLPYRLTKRVSLKGECTLRLDYMAENLTEYSMDYIWAAHMMLAAQKGCRFNVPKQMKRAYTTISSSGTLGKYGDQFNYPKVRNADGSIYDMSIYRGDDADDYQKCYFSEQVPPGCGWAGILYPDGRRLQIRFPEREVPYLGIIQGEGGEFNLRCMFLEPCTGAFDRPDLARKYGMNSMLKPFEKKRWYLEIEVKKEEI